MTNSERVGGEAGPQTRVFPSSGADSGRPVEEGPRRLGHVRLEQRLGAGGMGEVFLGFDEKLQRRVAVKTMRRHAGSPKGARERLLREARILSRLDHPGICRIHDLIEGPDSDHLVLELIEGKTLGEAIAAGMPRRRALEIAGELAEILAAAHQEGIVHRDLKPDNVMLTSEGAVKVLDFGISRVSSVGEQHVEGGGDGDLAITRQGSVLGTVAYMSPEQARGEEVTPASDVFSLALVVAEMVGGGPVLPHDTPLAEAMARVEAGLEIALPDGPRGIEELLQRATAPVPDLRPTAGDVAVGIRRLLDAPRRRRHRLAALGVSLLLLLAAAKYVVDLRRERSEAREARAVAEQALADAKVSRSEAEQVADFLADLFAASDPRTARGVELTARQLLDRGTERLGEELAEQPRVRARLMATIGGVYRRLGHFDEARRLFEDALAARRAHLGDEHLEVASSLTDLATVELQLGLYDESRDHFETALAVHEGRGDGDPDLGRTLNNFASLLQRVGELEAATETYERLFSWRRDVLGPEHPDTARSGLNLGNALIAAERWDDAARLLEETLNVWERTLGADHPDLAIVHNSLAVVHRDGFSRPDLARRALERSAEILGQSLGDEHPRVGVVLNNLAEIALGEELPQVAETDASRALAIFEEALGPSHQLVVHPLLTRGRALVALGRDGEAAPLLRRARELAATALGEEHEATLQAESELAALLARRAAGDEVGR